MTDQYSQRFHIDLGYSTSYVIKRIYLENWHTSGDQVTMGMKTFTFWGSNDAGAFADLVYSHDTNWTQLTCDVSELPKHVASDEADPQYINVTNDTGYRYYALKIADGWGDGTVGIRRIELQELL
jgi:hypothetical protein